jgi:hypothetical protein
LPPPPDVPFFFPQLHMGLPSSLARQVYDRPCDNRCRYEVILSCVISTATTAADSAHQTARNDCQPGHPSAVHHRIVESSDK